MTEWDPYYLDRGMFRPSPEEKARLSRLLRERFEEARSKHKDDAAQDKDLADTVLSTIVEAEQVAMRERLDKLDAETTAALMRNTEALDKARAQEAEMLEQAYVLPDGRRVFKTEDGTKAFDEFGQEVSADEIDPDAITGDHPTWEEYSAIKDEIQALEQEREELLD